jgi:uncharacterized protein YndB with AHSA1/START domain
VATARAEARIARDPDAVWQAITDPTLIASWFPGVTKCTCDGNVRHVWVANGMEVDEEIVTNDGSAKRFQYKLLPGPVPVQEHLATLEVSADGDGTLVQYSVEVQPDDFGGPMQETANAAMAGLKSHLES